VGLTAAQILALTDRAVESVDCPEWGGAVYVRSLSTAEAFTLELGIRGIEDVPTIMAAQLAAFLCDEAGVALFQSVEEAKAVLGRKTVVVRRLIAAGMALNTMGSVETEKEKS
jgi:hypothetical protein